MEQATPARDMETGGLPSLRVVEFHDPGEGKWVSGGAPVE